jgi:hypothetical protein
MHLWDKKKGRSIDRRQPILALSLALFALAVVAWQWAPESDDRSISPLATATPTSDVSLHLSVDLEGRPLPPAPAWETELELILDKRSTSEIRHVILTDELGTLQMEGLSPGLYDIRIRGINTLTNVRESILLNSGANPIHMGLLRAGDLNSDGRIDIVDFSQFRLLFGQTDSRGDLNNSGLIDILDFSLLRRNFGKQGPFVISDSTPQKRGEASP